MEVGVRELKAKLSEYLSRAAAGEDIVVTDRGKPFVRLVPFAQDNALQRGFEEGWIEAPRQEGLSAVERFRSSSGVLDVLDEDRG